MKAEDSIPINDWMILYDQADFSQSVLIKDNWQQINIPSTFLTPYPHINDFQFVWLKAEFNIDDDPLKFYGLSTGRVKYSDKIYRYDRNS